MQIKIRRSGNPNLEATAHWENVLTRALKRHEHLVRMACLYVEDVNGPRGGVDKQCRCVLHLRRLPPIVIQDRDASMNALVHRIANRAAFVLSEKADRRRTKAVGRRRENLGRAQTREEPIPADLLAGQV